jgi:DNA-binding MarR family transcriptional regulator
MNGIIPLGYRETFDLISEMTRALRCCQQDQVFCANLSFVQFSVLNALAEKGEMKLADLHQFLAVEKSTTTRLVDPLARQGLIRREKSAQDSRAQILKLTPQGRVVHGKIWECLLVFIGKIQEGLPRSKRRAIHEGIQIFLKALKNACNGRACRT